MKTVDALLKGYKPAFLENPGNRFTTKKLPLLLENYPYIDETVYDLYRDGYRYYIFFQTIQLRDKFLKKVTTLSNYSEVETELGLILGFPPKAVHFYVNMVGARRREDTDIYNEYQSRHIGIKFCGVSCAADINDITENVTWLWEKYPYQEAIKDGTFVRVGEERLQIPHGNIERLEMIKKVALSGDISAIHTLVS